MNDKAERILASQTATLEKAAETMWHDLFAQTVLELLAETRSVTLDDLRDALERRMAEDTSDRITKAKCRGALKQLRA